MADAVKATVEGKESAVENREGKELELSGDMHFSLPSMQRFWSQPMGRSGYRHGLKKGASSGRKEN